MGAIKARQKSGREPGGMGGLDLARVVRQWAMNNRTRGFPDAK